MSKSILILYASQTGQSEAIARNIAQMLLTGNVCEVSLLCFNEILTRETLDINFGLIIFVTSSTGTGDPPENGAKFWRKLKIDANWRNYFLGRRFTLLGLGDSNYTSFMQFPNALNEKLLAYGASHFYLPAFADDAVGLEIVVDPWIDGLISHIKCIFSSVCGDSFISALVETISSIEILNINEREFPIRSLWPDVDNLTIDSFNAPTAKESVIFCEYLSDACECVNRCDFLKSLWTERLRNTGSPMLNSLTFIRMLSREQLTRLDALKRAMHFSWGAQQSFSIVPGNSVFFVCENDSNEVDRIIARLNLRDLSNKTLFVKHKIIETSIANKGDASIQKKAQLARRQYGHMLVDKSSLSLRDILLCCVDIRQPPKKNFLSCLANACNNKLEKHRLMLLSSRFGADLYEKFIRQPGLSLLDLLLLFPSCSPSVDCLLEHLPPLMPRLYSVASMPRLEADTIQFSTVFNVVEINCSDSESRCYSRKGVCTGFIDALPIDSRVVVYINSNASRFRAPDASDFPLIMIGPGTGIAPFIGFIEHRFNISKNLAYQAIDFAPMILITGFRHYDRDFLFKDLIEKWRKCDLLVSHNIYIRIAISRNADDFLDELALWNDNPVNSSYKPCRYVQDVIKMESPRLNYWLTENSKTHIFVCGDAKGMAPSVYKTFEEILGSHFDSAEKASNLLKQMKESGRYVEDVWT